MATPVDIHVFAFIGATVTNAINAFVTPSASNLMFALKTVAISGIGLYFTLMGYMIMTGAIQESFYTFIKQCVKIIIVAAFALNADGYFNSVMTTFTDLETGLAAALNHSGVPATSIYDVLDQSFGKGLAQVGICFDYARESGITNLAAALGWIIAGCIVAASTLLIMLLGGATVITAKFALAIMFAVGPLFIMCLMWPMTARFFDSWFSQVLHYTLQVVIMAVVMSFAMALFDQAIQTAKFDGGGTESPMFAALQIGAMAGALIYMIKQVGGMASGLAGGISMAALTVRHLVNPGGTMGAITRTGNQLINGQSNRLDPTTGLQTSAGRLEHVAMGRTILNPAYRRAVMDRRRMTLDGAGGSVMASK